MLQDCPPLQLEHQPGDVLRMLRCSLTVCAVSPTYAVSPTCGYLIESVPDYLPDLQQVEVAHHVTLATSKGTPAVKLAASQVGPQL